MLGGEGWAAPAVRSTSSLEHLTARGGRGGGSARDNGRRGATCACNNGASPIGPLTWPYLLSFYMRDTPVLVGRVQIRPCCRLGGAAWYSARPRQSWTQFGLRASPRVTRARPGQAATLRVADKSPKGPEGGRRTPPHPAQPRPFHY